MKRVVLIILAMVVVLTGCSTAVQPDKQAGTNVQASNTAFVMAGIIDPTSTEILVTFAGILVVI